MTGLNAAPIGATQRYIPNGVRHIYWVPVIANKATPTLVELNAGTDLSAEIASVSGFSVDSGTIDAPDLGSRFTSQVSGMITAAKSSIDIYCDADSDDARTLLARDSIGFVVIFPEGIDSTTPAKTMDVFPANVSSNSIQQDLEKVAVMTVNFTITSQPVQNIAIPTV